MNHLEQINLEKDYYEVAEPHPIGQGAFGVFWKLRRLSDDREVALKTVQRRDPTTNTPYTAKTIEKIADSLAWETACQGAGAGASFGRVLAVHYSRGKANRENLADVG